MAVGILGHLLALQVTSANEQDRAQVAQLAEQEQDVTDASVEIASVDQGDTGDRARQDAADHGMQLEVVKRPHAKKGFVRLPRRWVVERSFVWAARFRRLARGYERLPGTLAGWHVLAFTILMLTRFVALMVQSA
jgi:transposase